MGSEMRKGDIAEPLLLACHIAPLNSRDLRQTRIGITTYTAVVSLPSRIKVGSPEELNMKTAFSRST
ncbi:recombination protein F [Rhodobacteraceae bacterium HTCC2150]|nr:recombination protein F [Rhodobacteraceae bacterium HTCC2150]